MKDILKSAVSGRAPWYMIASGAVLAAILVLNPPEGLQTKVAKPQAVAVVRVTPPSLPKAPVDVAAPTVDRLIARFDSIGYDLSKIRDGESMVPRVLPDAIPKDMAAIEQVDQKKSTFVRMVLPMVLVINESIRTDRARALSMMDRLNEGTDLSDREQAWLTDRFKEYKTDFGDFKTLLRRMDVVPPSLALAQAAIESGWGTSRFARKGNALFGQWTTDQFDGIVPKNREEGKTHKIRSFHAPIDSVASYLRNLNTHRAYKDLRLARERLRVQKQPLDSMVLAGTLDSYSEKGQEYVGMVQSIIRVNKLTGFDRARLAETRPRLRPSA